MLNRHIFPVFRRGLRGCTILVSGLMTLKLQFLQQEGLGGLGDPLLRMEKRVGCFTKKKRKNTKYIIHITIPPAPLVIRGE